MQCGGGNVMRHCGAAMAIKCLTSGKEAIIIYLLPCGNMNH